MSDPTAVLIRLCRHLGAFEREVTCCGPVTVQQCVVLQRLADGADDVGGLASFVGASQPAMTRLVSGMEQREWVLRVRDPSDKRRVVVSLTPSGRREAARLRV